MTLNRSSMNFRIIAGIVLFVVFIGLAAAWQWTPLKEWLDLELVVEGAKSITGNPAAPAIVLSAYVIGGLVVFPATLLIIATAIVFGPLTGFIYTLSGCLASALCLYGIGRLLGRETVQRYAGPRINSLNRQLERRGLLAVLFIRLAPIAPFSIINLVAGASRIKFRDFTLGTALGMAPGLFAITLFGDRLEDAVKHPNLKSLAMVAGLIIIIIAVNLFFKRMFISPQKQGIPNE